MLRWILRTVLFLLFLQMRPARADTLLDRLGTITNPDQARPLVQELAQRLREGFYYGEEVKILEATERFWQDSGTPPALLETLWEVYLEVLPAFVVQYPARAETLFVYRPTQWLSRKNKYFQSLAREVLRTAGREPLLLEALHRVYPRLLQSTPESETMLSLALEILDQLPHRPVVQFSWQMRRRLLAYRGVHLWRLPDLLALDTTQAGTQALLEFAEQVQVPPGQARWLTPNQLRQVVLERLKGRPLRDRQKQKVVRWFLNPELAQPAAELILKWQKVPPVAACSFPRLEQFIQQGEWAVCQVAVRLLAESGQEGVQRLFHLYRAAKAGKPCGCKWDLWDALRQRARAIEPLLQVAFQQEQAPWLLRLLGHAGDWERVFVALQATNLALRREAALLLSAALIPGRSRLKVLGDASGAELLHTSLLARAELAEHARQVLKSALNDPDPLVRQEALRTFVLLDSAITWASVKDKLRRGGKARTHALEALIGLDVPLPRPIIALLVKIALRSNDLPARLLAMETLRRSSDAAAQLSDFEPQLRALISDPREAVRQAAADYFVVVPARQLETVAALLKATEDASAPVRETAAMALAEARVFSSEQVQALARRLMAGDGEEDVHRKLENAYLHALRRDPGSVEALLGIILERNGPARWRKALREGPPVTPPVARALLMRLSQVPISRWLPRYNIISIQEMIVAEEDPPPWAIIRNLVPTERLNDWLLRQALEDKERPLAQRLQLLAHVDSIPAGYREAALALFIQAARQLVWTEWSYRVIEKLGFPAIRALVDRLQEHPQAYTLSMSYLQKRIAEYQAQAALPLPEVDDLGWIEAQLRKYSPCHPQLAAFLTLIQIHRLVQDPWFRRAIFQTKIPTLLHAHLNDPQCCPVVKDPLRWLLGRTSSPPCPEQ